MRTHAEVHEAIAQIIAGTRLYEFMVTTNSFRSSDGSVAVEWSCSILAEGKKDPEFYFRSRDPDALVRIAREGVELRRKEFKLTTLDSLRGPAPKDTALAEPARCGDTFASVYRCKLSPGHNGDHRDGVKVWP